MSTNCPHCGTPYDASHRMTGDRVWHPCGGWFLVVHRDGQTAETQDVVSLLPCDPPVSWPKERRKEQSK